MRTLLAIILTLTASFGLTAQTVQNGVVKEYNEKDQKTPLPGVELNIRSANSTVSDKDGNFSLNFLTLKPGERINVRRIEKLGYEVFNKEAVEQWNLNPKEPFTIVMCKSEKFKKIRDNYERVSSESYARQLKKEQDALTKLKDEGKLKDEEYQKQLLEIQETYDQQLDNLSNYIDRFSRIDLSELSSVEQDIIELIQQGRIDEAIQKYEDQNYLDKYIMEVSELKEVSQAIDQLTNVRDDKIRSRDSLMAALDRQIGTLRVAGGKENFDKIGTILHSVYQADSLNLIILIKYADFLFNIGELENALPLYERLKQSNNIKELAYASRKLILINMDLEHYESALKESLYCENLINSNRYIFNVDEIIGLYLNRGLIYNKCGEINLAKSSFNEALKISTDNNFLSLTVASVKNNLANILCSEHKYDDASALYESILEIYLTNNDSSEKSNERICGILLNMAQLEHNLNNLGNAEEYILESINYAEKVYKLNPYKYAKIYSSVLNTAGNITRDCNRTNFIEYYEQAIEIIKPQYEKIPSLFWRTYYSPCVNLGIYYTQTENYTKATEIFERIIEIIKSSPESKHRDLLLSQTLYNYSYIYCVTDEYLKAIPLLDESIRYAERLFNDNKYYGASQYLNSLSNLAFCYTKIGDMQAGDMYMLGKSTIEDLELCDTPPFVSLYADYLYNIGHHYHHMASNYDDAINYYLQSYSIYEKLNNLDEMIDVVVGLSESYMLKGDLTSATECINRFDYLDKCHSHIGWLHTKGLIALKSGDLDTAKYCRNQILSLQPSIDTTDMDLFKEEL